MSSEAGRACVTVKFVSNDPDCIVDVGERATAAVLTEEVRFWRMLHAAFAQSCVSLV